MAERRRKFAVYVLAAGMALALGACASKHADDPLYDTGYTDGCGSGTAYVAGNPSTLRRDDEGWAKSKAYRAGWKKGFNACRVTSGGQSSNMPDDAYGRRNGPSGY